MRAAKNLGEALSAILWPSAVLTSGFTRRHLGSSQERLHLLLKAVCCCNLAILVEVLR